MTYTATDSSQKSALPLELYEFRLGTTSTYWRYTSGPANLTYDGNTYTAILLKRGDIEHTFDALRNPLELEVDWSNPLAVQYISSVPDETVYLTVYRGHDPDYVTYWRGKIQNVKFAAGRIAKIVCSPTVNDLNRSCMVMRYGRLCGVPLYSTLCGAVEASFTVSGVIGSISGLTVTCVAAAAYADNWFRGGKFTANGYSRKILTHTSDTLRLVSVIPGLAIGQAFTATAGCDHVYTTCNTKFSNLVNCKAHPFIPDKNPFTGGPVI